MIVRAGSGGTPAPEGLHQAVCVDVVDMGVMETQFGPSHKIRVVFEVEDEGGSFYASKLYTASLGEKANLRKDLVSWRGRQFTEEELRGFDLETIVGAPCQILVVHNRKRGRTYGNVTSVIKAAKGLEARPSGKYVRVKDREDGHREWQPPEHEEREERADDEIPF